MEREMLARRIDAVYTENRYSASTFSDLMTLWDCTLRRYEPGAEDEYMATVGRMTKESVRLAPHGFGVLLQHFVVNRSYEDLLGPVYMDLASRWKRQGLGQYFTPWNVAVCMAEMVFSDVPPEDIPGMSINEPCVGSGVMLLAARHVVAQRHGREMASKLRLSGQDADPIVCRMARVQLTMTNDPYMTDFLLAMYGEMHGEG
jgi:type I restriction-modification system DNA methylase subunit